MEEEGKVISVTTVEEWTQQLEKGKESNKLVVVDFTASWCGPCRIMAPIFAELANVDELRTVAQEMGVKSMPTFLFLKEGKEVDKIVGARKDDLPLKIEQHATTSSASA